MAFTYGFLSTHPPTQCGLATFNSALAAHLTSGGELLGGIVRVTAAGDDERPQPGVVHTWTPGGPGGWKAAATALERFDVAIVQHEYGIYPGPDGQDVLPLLRRLTVPSIVVLHTVLTRPTPRQKALLEEIGAAAGAIVTMTGTARDRLAARLPGRHRQGVRHPARSRRPHAGPGPVPTPSAPAHLGTARAGQRHRVGVARARASEGPRPVADLHYRREDPPQSAGAAGRGLS
ncbi:hypothetical protein ACFSTC_20945 [Nonomuraea ferruginea]